MSELDDVKIRSPREPEEQERRVVWPLVAAVVVLLLAVGAWFFWFRDGGSEPATSDAGEPRLEASREPATGQGPDAERQIQLPALGESDALVRELSRQLSSHPELAALLVSEDLVRRFTAAVDNVATGRNPRPNLEAMAPDEPVAVERAGGRVILDPASYGRYDTVAAVFTSLDAAGTAELYRKLEPLIDAAYRELGYPDAQFDRTLGEAIRLLLATPVVDGPVELVPAVKGYKFADPELEALAPAQKALIRMGPDHQRAVQAKLRQVGLELGLV